MKSTLQKVQQVQGLLGTADVTPWESDFIESITLRVNAGKALSDAQLATLDRIHGKHFA